MKLDTLGVYYLHVAYSVILLVLFAFTGMALIESRENSVIPFLAEAGSYHWVLGFGIAIDGMATIVLHDIYRTASRINAQIRQSAGVDTATYISSITEVYKRYSWYVKWHPLAVFVALFFAGGYGNSSGELVFSGIYLGVYIYLLTITGGGTHEHVERGVRSFGDIWEIYFAIKRRVVKDVQT